MGNKKYDGRIRKYFSGLLLALMVFAVGLTGETLTLDISQVYVKIPELIVYANVLDGSGNPREGLSKEDFSALIGQHSVEVANVKLFDKATEGTAYMVLVDISRSLTAKEFQQIRQSLEIWIDDLSDKDRMCITSFGSDVKVLNSFTSNKEELKEILKTLGPTDGLTKFNSALNKAVETLKQQRTEDLPTRRVVVVLSDGKDDGSGEEEADVKAKIKEHHYPIYSIGYSRLNPVDKKKYLKVLNNLSTISGGVYLKAEANNLQEIYTTLRQAILKIHRFDLKCEECDGDSSATRLILNFNSGSTMISNDLKIRLTPGEVVTPPLAPPPPPPPPPIPMWVYIAGGLGVVLVFLLVLFFVNNSKKPEPAPAPEEGDETGLEQRTEQPDNKILSGGFGGKVQKKGIKIRLVDIGSGSKDVEYKAEVADNVTVGRNKECNIVIETDSKISRKHCEFICEDGNILLRDLDTINGTFVEGVPIDGRYRLENGERILLGDTELRIFFQRGD